MHGVTNQAELQEVRDSKAYLCSAQHQEKCKQCGLGFCTGVSEYLQLYVLEDSEISGSVCCNVFNPLSWSAAVEIDLRCIRQFFLEHLTTFLSVFIQLQQNF